MANVKVTARCDICGADFEIGLYPNAAKLLLETDVHLTINLTPSTHPRMFGGVYECDHFNHVCVPCRQAIKASFDATVESLTPKGV